MSFEGPILSIDDDEDDQYLLASILKELGVTNTILPFYNGQEAIDYLETATEHPFLILCDINMPIMNGLELRQRISANESLSRKAIPFVFLTTSADRRLVDLAYDTTIQGYFQKGNGLAKFRDNIQIMINYWQNCLHPHG